MAEIENNQELMTPLVESAIRLNEIFKALRHAGFTEDQALTLVQKAITNHQRKAD